MKIISVFILVGAFLCSNAQPTEEWTSIFFSNSEHSHPYPILKIDANENVIVAGGNFLIKYDQSGNELWSKILPGTLSNAGEGNDHLVVDSMNNIYVVQNDTFSRMVVEKYSSDGDSVWRSIEEGSAESSQNGATSITIFQDRLYITGSIRNDTTSFDIILVCFDVNTGMKKWKSTFNDTDNKNDLGYRVRVGNDESIFVAGRSQVDVPSGVHEFIAIKFDTCGNVQWTYKYDDDDYWGNLMTAMTVTSDNRVVMSGYYNSTVSINQDGQRNWIFKPMSYLPSNHITDRIESIYALADGGIILTGSHSSQASNGMDGDIVTYKINALGEVIWSQKVVSIYNLGYDTGDAISEDDNDDILVAGWLRENTDSSFNKKSILVKYDGESGEQMWEFLDDVNNDYIDTLSNYRSVKAVNSAIYITGTSFINGQYQFVTKKLRDHDISILNDISIESERFTLFPNPTKEYICIQAENNVTETVNIKLFDTQHRMVLESDNFNMKEELAINNLSSGLYYLLLNDVHIMKFIIAK